jgi:Ala-tRNA(Pro) deacylase
MLTKKQVYDKLTELGIKFEATEHSAGCTIEAMEKILGDKMKNVPKNIFVRDGSGERHFLIIVRNDKRVDLKSLGTNLNVSHLGFASDERLLKYLGVVKGSVTPLGLFNDEQHAVEVIFDSDLRAKRTLGFHPCDNSATVWIAQNDLMKIIKTCGNSLKFMKL